IRQRIHSLDVSSIREKGFYDWTVQLTNHQAEISRAHLEIRRNVETELPWTLWLGLGLLLGGILLGFFITRKPAEA
nr:hypothetical protein [Endozoicomonas sp.]